MADDIRKVAEKRSHILTLKLTEEEAEGLRQLAAENCRRPGDELRFLLVQALRRKGENPA